MRVTVRPGITLLQCPYLPVSGRPRHTLDELLGASIPDLSEVRIWDPATQSIRVSTYLGGHGYVPNFEIARGQGFAVRPSDLGPAESYDLFLYGIVPGASAQSTTTIPLVPGYNLIGYPYPVGTTLQASELHQALQESDQAFVWSTNSQNYAVFYRFDIPGIEWGGGEAFPIPAATAFFVHSSAATHYVSHAPYVWPTGFPADETGAWAASFPPRAPFSVNWNTGSNSVLTAIGAPAPSDWTAQLIWSPDNVMSPLDPARPYQPTGGEIALRTVPLNGLGMAGRVAAGQLDIAEESLVGGFLYTRVFNAGHNGGNPFFPSRYGQCEPEALTGPLLAMEHGPADMALFPTHAPRRIRVDQPIPVPVTPTPALRLAVADHQLQLSWTCFPYAFFPQESNASNLPVWRDLSALVTCQGSNHVAVVPVPEGAGRRYRLTTASP